MKQVAQILIIEDLPRWQEVLANALRGGGFEVDVAASKADAFEKLATRLYHLLVVDLRLEEPDPSNRDGMVLLEELKRYGLAESFQVIVITAYGTLDRMREAFTQHGVADFLAKQEFDERVFLAKVQELLTREPGINFGLTIHWQGGLTARQAVVNLLVDGQRVKKATPQQELLAVELDDLLCRLFHDADSLLVNPLSTGKSGAGVLLVQPFYPRGGGRPLVVKYGDARQISRERANVAEFVAPFVGGGRSTTVLTSRRTPRLAGIVYSLVGAGGNQLANFEGFYRSATLPQICQALDRLFLDTCGAWYENPGQLKPLDLAGHYFERLGMTAENLTHGLEDLKSVQGNDKLHFHALSAQHPLPNPLKLFPGRPLVLPTYETITHGDLNPQNILLDEAGNSWLIDFQATGPGHVLRDLAELDVAIRVQLLSEGEATLDERLALEEVLCKPQTYAELTELVTYPKSSNSTVDKALATCVHLRTLAARLLARQTSSDLGEYHAAALFCALNLIRFRAFPTVQREHALLSACLLTERHGF